MDRTILPKLHINFKQPENNISAFKKNVRALKQSQGDSRVALTLF